MAQYQRISRMCDSSTTSTDKHEKHKREWKQHCDIILRRVENNEFSTHKDFVGKYVDDIVYLLENDEWLQNEVQAHLARTKDEHLFFYDCFRARNNILWTPFDEQKHGSNKIILLEDSLHRSVPITKGPFKGWRVFGWSKQSQESESTHRSLAQAVKLAKI